MRKTKVLFVSEASWKNTGYSVYTKEVLSRLNQLDNFEVAELSCYASHRDLAKQEIPWQCFPNKPEPEDEDFKTYLDNPSQVFGERTFNHVLLKFKPDVVMDIRDWWMFEYQQRSPFRDFFHWAIMPTVDAQPQNTQWINTFASADSVFAYSEFGRDTMLNQCDKINFIDIASPAASKSFFRIPDKAAHKDKMGLSSDAIIFGTVMRNQKRKMYPDLLETFRNVLDRTKNPNIFLYCHHYYPDIGWDTPQLLDKFGLNNRVLFTYHCQKCKTLDIDFFKDTSSMCRKCKSLTREMVGINNSIDEKQLNDIYNTFDCYIQYANSEGFGMPQVEAAFTGLPVISVDYSAMESVIKNINAIPVAPRAYSMECETGCYRAVPDNNSLANAMQSCLDMNLTELGQQTEAMARERYNWDKTADVWRKRLEVIPLKDPRETWLSPPNIKFPATEVPKLTNLSEKMDFLFNQVLHKPEWTGSFLWSKICRDITFNYRVKNTDDGFYFNESHTSDNDRYEPFNFAAAVAELGHFRRQLNEWETLRIKLLQGGIL